MSKRLYYSDNNTHTHTITVGTSALPIICGAKGSQYGDCVDNTTIDTSSLISSVIDSSVENNIITLKGKVLTSDATGGFFKVTSHGKTMTINVNVSGSAKENYVEASSDIANAELTVCDFDNDYVITGQFLYYEGKDASGNWIKAIASNAILTTNKLTYGTTTIQGTQSNDVVTYVIPKDDIIKNNKIEAMITLGVTDGAGKENTSTTNVTINRCRCSQEYEYFCTIKYNDNSLVSSTTNIKSVFSWGYINNYHTALGYVTLENIDTNVKSDVNSALCYKLIMINITNVKDAYVHIGFENFTIKSNKPIKSAKITCKISYSIGSEWKTIVESDNIDCSIVNDKKDINVNGYGIYYDELAKLFTGGEKIKIYLTINVEIIPDNNITLNVINNTLVNVFVQPFVRPAGYGVTSKKQLSECNSDGVSFDVDKLSNSLYYTLLIDPIYTEIALKCIPSSLTDSGTFSIEYVNDPSFTGSFGGNTNEYSIWWYSSTDFNNSDIVTKTHEGYIATYSLKYENIPCNKQYKYEFSLNIPAIGYEFIHTLEVTDVVIDNGEWSGYITGSGEKKLKISFTLKQQANNSISFIGLEINRSFSNALICEVYDENNTRVYRVTDKKSGFYVRKSK